MALMLLERSTATTMSTPLAVIRVSPSPTRGWARATMNKASDSQRSRSRITPACDRRTPVMPRTNCTDE